MRITNVDTLSALFDRLISENIKLFFFEKENKMSYIEHQKGVILELRKKVSDLLIECFENGKYEFISEKRTWSSDDVVEELEELVVNDIVVGESDRGVLKEVTSKKTDLDNLKSHAKRMRKANEGRALNKNNIDDKFKDIVSSNSD